MFIRSSKKKANKKNNKLLIKISCVVSNTSMNFFIIKQTKELFNV